MRQEDKKEVRGGTQRREKGMQRSAPSQQPGETPCHLVAVERWDRRSSIHPISWEHSLPFKDGTVLLGSNCCSSKDRRRQAWPQQQQAEAPQAVSGALDSRPGRALSWPALLSRLGSFEGWLRAAAYGPASLAHTFSWHQTRACAIEQ